MTKAVEMRATIGKLAAIVCTLFAAVCLGVVGAPHAAAHDAITESTPADGAELTEFPTEIHMVFTGIPRDGFNTVAITDADHKVIFQGEPTVEGNSITLPISADVKPGAGNYTVGYQIISSDGHNTKGQFAFTVAGDPAVSETATAENSSNAPAASESEEAKANKVMDMDVLIPVGLAIAAAVVLIVVLVRRKR